MYAELRFAQMNLDEVLTDGGRDDSSSRRRQRRSDQVLDTAEPKHGTNEVMSF